MANRSGSCGTANITYDEVCTFLCFCTSNGCFWTVSCPGPGGEGDWTVTSGKGREVPPEPDTTDPIHVGFDGPAEAFAVLISEKSGKRITVPKSLVGKRVTIHVDGGWDTALQAAGF